MTFKEAKKLKIGDKVVIRYHHDCDMYWCLGMNDFVGKTVTITGVSSSDDRKSVWIEIKESLFKFKHTVIEKKIETYISQEVFDSLKPGDKIRIVDDIPGWCLICTDKMNWKGKILTVSEGARESCMWGKYVSTLEDHGDNLWFRECIAEKVEEKKPRFAFIDESGEEHEFKGFRSIDELHTVTVDLSPDDPKNSWFVTTEKPNDIILRYNHSGKVLAKRDGDGKWNIIDEGVKAFGELAEKYKKAAEAITKLTESLKPYASGHFIPYKPDDPKCPFKVGDRVRFKTWEQMEKEFGVSSEYGCIFNCTEYIECPGWFFKDGMKPLCGTYATIKSIRYVKGNIAQREHYVVELDDFSSKNYAVIDSVDNFTADMLELANECPLRFDALITTLPLTVYFDWHNEMKNQEPEKTGLVIKKKPEKTDRIRVRPVSSIVMYKNRKEENYTGIFHPLYEYYAQFFKKKNPGLKDDIKSKDVLAQITLDAFKPVTKKGKKGGKK